MTLFIDDFTIYRNSLINIFTLIPVVFEKNYVTTLSKKSELSVPQFLCEFLSHRKREG